MDSPDLDTDTFERIGKLADIDVTSDHARTVLQPFVNNVRAMVAAVPRHKILPTGEPATFLGLPASARFAAIDESGDDR